MHNSLYRTVSTVALATMLELMIFTCMNQQFSDYFVKEMNFQEILYKQKLCT